MRRAGQEKLGEQAQLRWIRNLEENRPLVLGKRRKAQSRALHSRAGQSPGHVVAQMLRKLLQQQLDSSTVPVLAA
jgi:hypothetical protein